MHLQNALLERTDHLLNVCIGMSRRQEAGEAFLDVNPLLPHVIIEEAAEADVGREAEKEDGPEMLDLRRNLAFLEEPIEPCYEPGRFFVERLLQPRALFLQMQEDSA